ncbi:MAG: UDP-N-acetylmuramoyl-tripeptide--D-alanyl-D-alanine ligase [Bacteroidota bacterium]
MQVNIQELYRLYLLYPSVQTDTRKLQKGDIFFALSGPNFNGNTFARQALAAGAAYAIIDNKEYATDDRCILVDNVLDTLQQLALYHRQQFNIPFIGITGSNGKTTTKELITSVLRQRFITYATDGNLNNHIGVPLTLLKIKKDAQIAVIEMGANHQKEIESYCKIALPTHGIITNCGKAHIEGFGGVEGVRKGKGELFDFLRAHNGTIFRNTDLDYLVSMSQGIQEQITYGSTQAQYTGTAHMNGTFLQVNIPADNTIIHSHLVGSYNFPNVMVAVAVGTHFGISMVEIKKAIEAYEPDNSRSQWIQRGTNKIILDAYNANPTSMRAAIDNFAAAELPKKILWIGGMKEMGADESKEHQELVAIISQNKWEDVILVGKEFKGLNGAYRWFENSELAKEEIKKNPPLHASILIKGSRGSKMEVLLEALAS